jgi:hypothetical protein
VINVVKRLRRANIGMEKERKPETGNPRSSEDSSNRSGSFVRVDLKKKMRFKGIEPLADRLTKETKVMMIGEFHGGTRAFSKENLLGTARILEQMNEHGKSPDMLIINGGLLPTVPTHISRRNQDRMRFLAPGINTIEDAIVVVRPHLKRLLSHLNGTKVVYVLGDEDVENMKFLKDEKVSQMKSKKAIAQKIESLELERDSLQSRLQSITHSQRIIENKMEELSLKLKGEDKESKKKKLERSYNALAANAKKLAKESDKVQRKIKARNRQITSLMDEIGQLGAVKRTKTERLTPEENRMLDEDVRETYFELIREIFEGAGELEIFDSRISVFNLNGISVGLGHNLSDTSTMAKKSELALKEYVQNKNELYRLLPPLDILLFSHHPGTKCWCGPKHFGNEGVSVIFQQGSFADPKLISDAWNKNIRLPQTDSVNRYHFDSGLTLITANTDGSFTFDLIGHQELKKEAQVTHNAENAALHSRLRGGVSRLLKKAQSEADSENGSQEALELGYIHSKLPSELDDFQLAQRIKLIVENGADKQEVIDTLAPKKEVPSFHVVKAEVHSDTHIGTGNNLDDWSNYELLEACIMDSNAKGLPQILVFGGDMVEGALGSKLNEYVARNYIDQQEFLRRVEDKAGLSPKERIAARMEYMQRQMYASPVTVIEEQVNRLAPLIRHAVDVVSAGGDVVLVSGNHYNQTHRNEHMDEATHLAKDIRLLGGFGQNHPRIHVFYGGWQGSGEVTVSGVPLFGIHKGKGTKDKITGFMDHRIKQKRPGFFYVEGHYHTPVFGKDLAGVFLAAPSIAPLISFVDQAALKAGTRGYSRVDFFVDDQDRHKFRAKITNVLMEQLKKYLEPIDENYLKILKEMFRQSRK